MCSNPSFSSKVATIEMVGIGRGCREVEVEAVKLKVGEGEEVGID